MKKSSKDRLIKKQISSGDRYKSSVFLMALAIILSLTGCGGMGGKEREGPRSGTEEDVAVGDIGGAEGALGDGGMLGPGSAIANESAADAEVDFEAVRAENPDIFAWLYVPGAGIDCPVLQSGIADDYYESHDAYGDENGSGAVYTEMANLMDMTDFNTVLHGKGAQAGDGFAGLFQFADPGFFEENEKIYLYLDGNVLTYEIFAAFEREDDSLIRRYDFTSREGCDGFLGEVYAKGMGKQVREGWEGLTPDHFLITLTTKADGEGGKQFVVIGALVRDAAGTIDREAWAGDGSLGLDG